MNRFPIFLLLICVCVAGCKKQSKQHQLTKHVSDSELQRLTAAMDSARGQSDMNEASGDIAKYWDRRLAAIERKILRKLDAGEKKQFEQSIGRWQFYRLHEVEFEAFTMGKAFNRWWVTRHIQELQKIELRIWNHFGGQLLR